ncbi:MAG: protein kinase [Planctomycetaceae bacterium]
MPAPSDNLIRQLTEWRLCSRQDIDACEPIVRRLCHDLPDFDSVWLDALVQRRILTPWQASTLQSARADRVRQGDFVLLEPLGTATFLARSVSDDRPVVLREIADSGHAQPGHSEPLSREPADETEEDRRLQRLQDLIESLDRNRNGVPPSIALPREVLRCEHGRGLWLVAPYVAGWRLDDLLVRGGRLPVSAVCEIGRDLLSAVCWLETQKLVHGDISLRNVRLRPDGRAVLVDPFVSRLTRPSVSFRADLRLRDVEFTAPELAGTAGQPSVRSELYSVGCVLWQLLTSRPAFLSADPLTKLLKSQERDVDDVRILVPDCPDQVARQIQSLTRRSPELRPATAQDALKNWMAFCEKGHSRTRSLLHRLPDRRQVSSFSSPSSRRRATGRNRFLAITTTTVCLVMAVFVGIQRGLIPSTLKLGPHASSIGATPSEVRTAASAAPADADRAAVDKAAVAEDETPIVDGMRSLPSPGAAGVVVLRPGETYRATALQSSGTLRVECPDGRPAIVKVASGMSWHLAGNQVVLRNVEVRRELRAPAAGDSSAENALLEITCDRLSLGHCILRNSATDKTASCVVWQPSAVGTEASTSVELIDCALTGSGWGVLLKSPAERCSLTNVLLQTGRAAMRCDVPATAAAGAASLDFELTRVSQVSGDSFLDVLLNDDEPAPGILTRIVSGESVLSADAALVRFASSLSEWSPENLLVEFRLRERGNPTIVPGSVRPVVYFDRSLSSVVELDPSQILVEALLFANPVFRGKDASTTNDPEFAEFELLDYEGPKLSTVNLPGVNVRRLP